MSDKYSQVDQRLPPLNTLRVFEAAARHASFVRAAAELHVTHGAVSRQISQLESSLEVALFERRNRAVFLTQQGNTLLATCQDIMGRLADTVRAIKAPVAPLPLVLSCEPTIAIRWLVPRLPDFRSRYPELEIHLLTAGGPVDFARSHVDLALRRNDFNWGSQCHAEPVAPELMGPVCAPALLTPSLQTEPQRLLQVRTRPDAWKRWRAITGLSIPSESSEPYEHFYLSLQAASSGLGLAIGSAYMVEADLKDGRLAAPFGFIPDGSQYVLLSPVPFDQDARRLACLDWFRQAMGQTRMEIDGANTRPATQA
jgi:LysR family transcriptional regulator, glycine cleavage system transcriptional activator